MRPIVPFALLLLLAGCAAVGTRYYDDRFGPADPTRHDVPVPGKISYRQEVQPILDRRCVVCHACYDASCQLKLGSWEGVARGASKEAVYDAGRLEAAPPSRLHIDAQRASEWRKRGFFPVLNEQDPTPANNRAASLLYRMLELKQSHPAPTREEYDALDFSLGRTQTCAAGDEFDRYAERNPLGGMPFGLPAIAADEHRVIENWLSLGAPGEPASALPQPLEERIAQWEGFLNGDSPKQQLVTRYLYEHLFLAHLYFDDVAGTPRFFRLIRSRTAPGSTAVEIPSRRPVDAPGVDRVYYRFVPEQETIVNKTHMPYALNAKRMARWQQLFMAPDYAVKTLPGYDAENISNPFRTYRDLPVSARYRFMIEEAEFTVMNFIKGPVCRGQVALNVIDDQFWVFFVQPDEKYDAGLETLLADESDLLRLPTSGSNTGILMPWLRYGDLERKYLTAKSAVLKRSIGSPKNLTLARIWDGDGSNPNAALTIFRHFDSASVEKGLIGDTPKSAWVIGYPMLERIHYLLVANYDVYGNLGHQLNSRLHMEYLRMEGEFNTLIFLPQADRIRVRDHWYRGDSARTRDQVYGGDAVLPIETGIQFRTEDPMRELMGLLRTRLAPIVDRSRDIEGIPDAGLRQALQQLAAVRGPTLSLLPELSHLAIIDSDGKESYFSLIRNTGHSTVSHLLAEAHTLLPAENTLTVARGLVGSYPNTFYRIDQKALPDFTRELAALGTEHDYTRFADRYAVRRSNPTFWAFSDTLHARHAGRGLLDYNRLDNR